MDWHDLGKLAWDKHRAGFVGRKLPPWEDLDAEIQILWMEVARTVVVSFLTANDIKPWPGTQDTLVN